MDTPAVADGPIAFVTNDGQQVFIPLSAISFSGGAVKSTFTYAGLQEWLNYLVAQGRLAPDDAPAAAPAMVFTAAVDGAEGNEILVEVKTVGTTAVEITVTETYVATGLNFTNPDANFVGKVLAATQTGPVRVMGAIPAEVTPPAVPADDPDEKVFPLASATTWEIKHGATVLMTLTARPGGFDKGTMIVSVGEVDAHAHTFTLTVKWTHSVTVGQADLVDPLPASSPLRELAFAVQVTKPSSGSMALPRPGAVMLRGGAERVPPVPQVAAKKATATLLANA